MNKTAKRDEISPLPMGKILRVAWQGIRIRIWRSLLVVSGIILAIAFLSYILFSDAYGREAIGLDLAAISGLHEAVR